MAQVYLVYYRPGRGCPVKVEAFEDKQAADEFVAFLDPDRFRHYDVPPVVGPLEIGE